MNNLPLLLYLLILQLQIFSLTLMSSTEHNQVELNGSSSNLHIRAYDWMGALSNEGFRIREGQWVGRLTPGEHRILSTYLFAGNKYWFCVATNAASQKINLMVLNQNGIPENPKFFSSYSLSSLYFEPRFSGRYFIKLELKEDESSEFCLLYSYRKK